MNRHPGLDSVLAISFPPANAQRNTRQQFTPRVVGGCSPTTQQPRPRRTSSVHAPKPSFIHKAPSAAAIHSPPFPRPAYLDHSAFCNLIHTDNVSVPTNIPQPQRQRLFSPPSDSEDDSVSSPPRNPPPVHILPAHDPVFRLPTRWSDSMKNSMLSTCSEGRTLSYHGPPCNGERDAAAARTDNPIPHACGIYYYEVEIISKGTKGHISIGFAGPQVKLSRLPGWEKDSWGYHGDDGLSFAADKKGTRYGPTYGTGDFIGCGVDFSTHRAFYTVNGTLIGPVFENVGRDVDIYPSIGLRHSGESVRANFGQEPFKYDIDYHVQQQRNSTWSRILATPIDLAVLGGKKRKLTAEEIKAPVKHLVLSYLHHHGYVKTAQTLYSQLQGQQTCCDEGGDVNMAGPSTTNIPDRDTLRRIDIVQSVVKGDIAHAIRETREYYPSALEDGLMLLKLKCRQFVELLLTAVELKKKMLGTTNGAGPGPVDGMDVDSKSEYEHALNEAIVYGRALRRDHGKDATPESQAIIKRTLGIVAFHDPLQAGGEAAALAGKEARGVLANELNEAILKSQGFPARPPLEMLFRVTSACVQQLGILGEGSAAFADLQKELLDI